MLCLLMAFGCGDDAADGTTIDLSVDQSVDGAILSCSPPVGGSCATACAADEVCATAGGGFNRHAPTCLKKCTVSSDCSSGMICAELYAEMLSSSVCISGTSPPPCGVIDSGYHCDFPPASCLDATTLLRPFSQQSNGVCGHEHQRCATSCVDASDGGAAAHCE